MNINFPLLDVIKQVTSYAKFLKDLSTIKRKLKAQKKAFLADHVRFIFSTNNKLKYKDPSYPTIYCVIEDYKIEHALFDLGASVNLLSYSVYQQLNLSELNPTSTTSLFSDRSIKASKGIIENVLVQVNKFSYHMDFIILESKPIADNTSKFMSY